MGSNIVTRKAVRRKLRIGSAGWKPRANLANPGLCHLLFGGSHLVSARELNPVAYNCEVP